MYNIAMRPFLPIFLFFVLTSIGYAQTYKKAKVYLDNHKIVKAKNLKILANEVTFFNTTNQQKQRVGFNNLKLIRIAKGSHALDGALYGAGTLALTALFIDIQPDDPLGLGIERNHGVGFYLGYTAAGAALGVLIGSLFPKWKSIYANGKFIGLNLPLKLDLNTHNNQLNLKIRISI